MCAASGVDLSRDALVRIDFDQAAQSRYLQRGELFGYPVLRRGGRRLAVLARYCSKFPRIACERRAPETISPAKEFRYWSSLGRMCLAGGAGEPRSACGALVWLSRTGIPWFCKA